MLGAGNGHIKPRLVGDKAWLLLMIQYQLIKAHTYPYSMENEQS